MMSLLESVILLDVMEIISSEDDGSGHFGVQHDSLQDSASDGDVGGEWALLINVSSFLGGLWGLETYKNTRIRSNTLNLPSPTFL